MFITSTMNLQLVLEGPVAATAGDLAPPNLATGKAAFALDELSGFGHLTAEVNDGKYGNPFSWIGNGSVGTSGPFIGINLGATPVQVSALAFGRSNVLAGDPCAGGVCTDRSLGLYRLQYTTTPNPNAATPDGQWIEIGTINYQSAGGDNFTFPHRRHGFNFDVVNATGVRLIVPASGLGAGTAIDEIELYADHFDVTPGAPALTLIQTGGSFAPSNLAAASAGATAFAKDVINNGGFPAHQIAHLIDGQYGNDSSWIGNTATSFAGVRFASPQSISSIAWGRDNGGEATVFTDRAAGTYMVQYTTVANPSASTPDGDWVSFQAVNLPAAADSALRHRYSFSSLNNVTGVRILTPSGAAIDEIEVYASATLPALQINPASGFSITWDGNNGDHIDGPVPDNDALASNGATAFGSGELQPTGIHRIVAVNDGVYGNANSWISNGTIPAFIGLDFNGLTDIDRIAWGRSNVTGGDACGVCTDRNLGVYTLQFTQVAGPGVATAVTGDPATGWQTIGTFNYTASDTTFISHLRHEYELAMGGGPISATGIRIVVSDPGIAIDELEVYGPDDPDIVFGTTLTATELLPDPAELVINEAGIAGDAGFFIELYNPGVQAIDLTGYVLATSDPLDAPYVLPAQMIGAGQFVSFDAATLGFNPADEQRVFFYAPGQATMIDAVRIDNELRGRSIEHEGRWLWPDAATPGAANSFTFNHDVVINEIMYHHFPIPATPGTPATFDTVVLLPVGATWRYTDSNLNLGAGWANTAHPADGSTWFSGPGPIGYEVAALPVPLATTLNNPISPDLDIITYYFETEFTFNDSLDGIQLQLNHMIDDGAVFYLNGVEVLRHNLPGGAITSSTLSNVGVGDATFSGQIIIPHDSLIVGTNRLSVEVHQQSTNSSDVVFGMTLQARRQTAPPTPGTPFMDSSVEWIELYNRGGAPVDLTGWMLDDAVQFAFPAGAMIQPGQYLVIVEDLAAFMAEHPGVPVVGQYSGGLSNNNETVRLIDAAKNPADEVHYYDGGRWHDDADGGGSSLELRDPFADNSIAEAWAPSDELPRSEWVTYTYRGVVTSDGSSEQYREFILGLLNDGEVLLDDISVIRDPDGAAVQILQNGSFEADTLGASPAAWRILGTHSGEVVLDPDDAGNKVLHLTATGAMEDRLNHAETTTAGNVAIINGVEYEVSFRARWVAGSNQLNTHFYFNRLPRTTLVQTPSRSGTPGEANTARVANIGPTYQNLSHGPVVPNPNQPVIVSVHAADPDGVASMTLHYRPDGGSWQMAAMTHDGGGNYSGVIPGHSASTVVQFYVEGVDGAGASSTFPAAGPDSRALYKVQDGQASDGLLHNFRIIMLAADSNFLHTPTNQLSNAHLGTTIVYNESVVHYDAGVRLKGSNAGRSSNTYLGFSVFFDPMDKFRGVHDSMDIDRSGRGSTVPLAQDEILIKHIANTAGGIPYMYDDLVHVIAPNAALNRTALLVMAGYGDVFLDSQFENGGDGTVFKLDIAYVPNGTVDGNPESLKLPFPYNHPPSKDLADFGTDKEAYRQHLLIRNNRAEDDYSAIVAVSQAMSLSGQALADAVMPLIDYDQWARVFALQSLTGAADTYTRGGLHHNIDFYVRPSDGKVLALPWDWDFAFTAATNQSLVGPTSNFNKVANLPGNLRVFHGHLLDLINTTFNSAYMADWTAHYGQVAGQNYSAINGYIDARRTFVLANLLPRINTEPFLISTPDSTVGTTTATLTGRGGIEVREIRLAGSDQPLPVQWTTDLEWRLTLPVGFGDNLLDLEAYDYQGALIGTDSVTITSTVSGRPLEDYLRITEIHYNPAGDGNAEFIELKNLSDTETLDLTGVRFTTGIDFDFTGSSVTSLAPGGYVLVVRDLTAFVAAYNTDGMLIAGEFANDTALGNGGEQLVLEGPDNQTLFDFAFDDAWLPLTDGGGPSLDVIDPAADPATLNDPASWRMSGIDHGTPGRPDPLAAALPGDVTYNGVVDITDLSRLATNFGLDGVANPALDVRWKHGDFNADRRVNITDLSLLATRFGQMQMGAGDGAETVDLLGEVAAPKTKSQSTVLLAPRAPQPTKPAAAPAWSHIASLLDA